MRKNSIKRVVAAMLVMAVMMAAAVPAYAVQPRYADIWTIDCRLGVSDNVAQCYAKVIGESDYHTYTIHMVLYQDDEDYAEWDVSGVWLAETTEYCYVTRGHEYYIGVHVKAYDEDGNFIEQAIAYTNTYNYQ